MEDRITKLQKMLEETYTSFTEDTNEYIKFLKVAAYNYNFNFTNQTLIYSQMPDAFIVSDHDFWYKNHGRYINKGAKAAQICRNVNNKPVVAHVFDYRDTNRRDGVEINFWQINEQNKIPMMNILNEHGYMLNENTEIRVICEPIKAKLKNQDISEEEIYKFVRTSCYLQILARTNPVAYAENLSNYIDLQDLELLKKLDYSDIRNIGVVIRGYMLGISQELERKNNELINEQDLEAYLKKDKEKLIEKTKEIARSNAEAGLPRAISASSQMLRFIRIYTNTPNNEVDMETYNELSNVWYEEWDRINEAKEEMQHETVNEIADEVVEANIVELENDTELTVEEIKDIIREYVIERLHDADDYDTEIVGIELYGSRIYDVHDINSDIDVAIEFKGENLREDSLFNVLNDENEPLTINGIRVDINPIVEERSTNIKEFIDAHKDYRKPTVEETSIGEFVIPQDFIEKHIVSIGTGTVDGKYRLYDAAINKEYTGVMNILKKEMASTMYGGTLPGNIHGMFDCSSKGIKYKLFNSDESKTIKWSEVAKIIIDAVEAGTYLNEREKAGLSEYYRKEKIKNGELLVKVDNQKYTEKELGYPENAIAVWEKDEKTIIRYVQASSDGYEKDIIEYLSNENGKWDMVGNNYPEYVLSENGAYGNGFFTLSAEQFDYLKEQIRETAKNIGLESIANIPEVEKTLITTRSAMYLNEDNKYVVLSPTIDGASPTKELPLYVGLSSNYDNHGHYDNSDGSLKVYENRAFLYNLVYKSDIRENADSIRENIPEEINATDEELLSYYKMAQTIKADFSPMERVASYKTGDFIFFNGEDFRIAIDDFGITLEHPQYPLFNKQVTKEMLEKAIFEDEISNAHLIKNEHVGFSAAKEKIEQTKENAPIEFTNEEKNKIGRMENLGYTFISAAENKITFKIEDQESNYASWNEVEETIEGLERVKEFNRNYEEQKKKHYPTLEERNYRALMTYAPEIVNGKYTYMKKESDVYEPLYIQKLSHSQYAMAHTYIQNGDLMYDPEVTFTIDEEKKTLTPLSYEQSGVGGGLQLNLTERQRKDIGQFMSQWFKNLKEQGHELTFVRGEQNGQEYEVNVKEALSITSAARFSLDPNYVVMSIHGDTNLYVGKSENYYAPYYDESNKDLLVFSNASHLFSYVAASESLSKDKENSLYQKLQENNMLNSDIEKALKDAMYIRQTISETNALEVDGVIENDTILEDVNPKAINAELNRRERYNDTTEIDEMLSQATETIEETQTNNNNPLENASYRRDDLDEISDELVEHFFIYPETAFISMKTEINEAYSGGIDVLKQTIKEQYKDLSESSGGYTFNDKRIRLGHIPKASGVEININGKYVEKNKWIRRLVKWDEAAKVISKLIESNRYMVGNALGEAPLEIDYSIPNKEEKVNESLMQYVGTELELEDRKYIIDEIGTEQVSLKDVTFENGAGFPIFRSESLEWLQYVLEQTQEDISREVKDERLNFEVKEEKLSDNYKIIAWRTEYSAEIGVRKIDEKDDILEDIKYGIKTIATYPTIEEANEALREIREKVTYDPEYKESFVESLPKIDREQFRQRVEEKYSDEYKNQLLGKQYNYEDKIYEVTQTTGDYIELINKNNTEFKETRYMHIDQFRKEIANENDESSIETNQKIKVTYTVAECGEFHNLGEYHENIETPQKAIEIFNSIPSERLNGVKKIGINVHKEGTNEFEDEQYDLYDGKEFDIEYINAYETLSTHPDAIKGINDLLNCLPQNTVIVGEMSFLDIRENKQEIVEDMGLHVGDVIPLFGVPGTETYYANSMRNEAWYNFTITAIDTESETVTLENNSDYITIIPIEKLKQLANMDYDKEKVAKINAQNEELNKNINANDAIMLDGYKTTVDVKNNIWGLISLKQHRENGAIIVSMDATRFNKIKEQNEIALEDTDRTENSNIELNEEKPILTEGDVFMHENKKWVVRKNDGFMLSADNLDPTDSNSAISWIGNIENHEYTLLERDGKPYGAIANDTQETNHNNTAENFVITNDELGFGGAKEKYRNNVAAIRTLKLIESEKRLATAEEQEVLSKYVGWGGIANAFNETDPSWSNEYKELKELLTTEEYNAARESVLSAFYTQPAIIRAIYKAIDKWGFTNGNILEPSCGTGNFFGMLPQHMQNSNMYGIELDDITGRIAKQLYQKNNILIQGYEKADLPDNFFDVALGNVPFGQFGVADKRYDKNNFLIHDYFFAKTLDKVRSGGIIAFVTSKGTMDKANQSVRKYITERAEFLGAIRLPSDAFKQNAGTEAVADIIFLKKRDTILDIEAIPEEQKAWLDLDTSAVGLPMNSYFVENPSMIMGTIEETTAQYGRKELGVRPFENRSLEDGLNEAIIRLPEYKINAAIQEENEMAAQDIIPARADVKNNSFTIIDGQVYYREDSIMKKVNDSGTTIQRIKGMIAIRDAMREVIDLQVNNESDEMVEAAQKQLNEAYDSFTAKYGLINSNQNRNVFGDDNSYCLISALEDLDENKELKAKSALFTRRTITPTKTADRAESSQDALAMSMSEKGAVDLEYMEEISGIPHDRIIEDLKDIIYPVPNTEQTIGTDTIPVYVMADEYLSGNVREKLRVVKEIVEKDPQSIFAGNLKPLTEIQPIDLTASEIVARLGANWIPIEYYTQFVHETMELMGYKKDYIKVVHNKFTNNWMIEGKQMDKYSTNSTSIWGTKRKNAYEIIELCMNQQVAEVTDTYEDEDGKKRTKKNFKETILAQEKQDKWKEAFSEWIFKDIDRREHIVKIYNELFNSDRPRQYSGKYLKLENINNEVELREHQKDAVAHAIYGGNTLFDHCVGAGKTYEMIATAMESKRLGLCSKTIIAVPNHLTMQVGKDFLKLYPSANILVADKKSFEKQNRKKFCSKIATGEWDAVIIGHSQFERIPVSPERQERTIQQEIDTLENALVEAKLNRNEKIQVKELERSKKALQTRLSKLIDEKRKDDVIYFEELGVDKMIVDEAHLYKNLQFPTKMSRINGVGGGDSQRAMDMYMKCQYMDEKTNSKGIVFATGTPISNSMSELFVMQKYLYSERLKEKGLEFFDTWAATFGEVETKLELKPEGTGYYMKSRFCKYNNLPELLNMFYEFTDIKTKEMIKLPVPEDERLVSLTKPTEYQSEILLSLAKRADEVREGHVDSKEDNMLKITNDGRKLALDQRMIDPTLEDDPNSKVNKCVENVFDIYKKTSEVDEKGKYIGGQAQVIFCDLSTPKKDGFSVYNDIKEKLMAKGVGESEIAFIQDAGTGTSADTKKEAMFKQVREGKIRVIMGSTTMMGTGANMQNKLIALHHLDCPWRPSDLEQRDGRIVRQGNENDKVQIYKYITERTFDAYMFQLIENKQKFISQIQNGTVSRTSEVIEDKQALESAELKALATGNPMIMEKVELENKINKLSLSRKSHIQEQYLLESKVERTLPEQIKNLEESISKIKQDISTRNENTDSKYEQQPIIIKGNQYYDWKDANEALVGAVQEKGIHEKAVIGEYRGFKISAYFDTFYGHNKLVVNGNMEHSVHCSQLQNINRLDAAINALDDDLANYKLKLENTQNELEITKSKLGIPFNGEEELKQLMARLSEVNLLLHDDTPDMTGEADENITDKNEQPKEPRISDIDIDAQSKELSNNMKNRNSSPIVRQPISNESRSNHNNSERNNRDR